VTIEHFFPKEGKHKKKERMKTWVDGRTTLHTKIFHVNEKVPLINQSYLPDSKWALKTG
jgi:hypothetical protein